MAPKNLFIVVSGPSGAGKTTLCQGFLARVPGISFSVSATTRKPRPEEKDGVDYFFLSEEEFARRVENQQFLEWAQYCGHRYGTLREHVMATLARGQDVLLDIDTQGAAEVRRKWPGAVLVFVSPPSLAELKERIDHRATESAEDRAKRLATAIHEMSRMEEYDYLVVNRSIEDGVAQLAAIVTAERCRMTRRNGNWLNSFLNKGEVSA